MMSAAKYIGVIASYIALCFLFIWGAYKLLFKLTQSEEFACFCGFSMFIIIIITSFLAGKTLGWFKNIKLC